MQESMARGRSRSTEATWTSFASVAISRQFDGVARRAPRRSPRGFGSEHRVPSWNRFDRVWPRGRCDRRRNPLRRRAPSASHWFLEPDPHEAAIAGASPKKPVMRCSRPSAARAPTSIPATITVPSGLTRSQAKRSWL
jgi:hypothetical protein